MKTFWMVLKDKLDGGAHVRHNTLKKAKEEALILCEKEKVNFFILRATESVQPKESPFEAEWKKLK